MSYNNNPPPPITSKLSLKRRRFKLPIISSKPQEQQKNKLKGKEEMSARGKRKDEEDHASEGDVPPSKTFKKDSDDTDEIVVCEISKNRRVMVRNWQGKIVVDIREFYVKDGKQMPGKKGISLSLDQWNVLRNHVEEIDKAVNENSSGD